MATPALIFPPDGDKNRRSVILGVCWTECAVAMIVVLLRVLSRLMIRGLGVDDWAMFLTMALFIALCGVSTAFCNLGGERHLVYLPSDQLTPLLRLDFVLQPIGIMALCFAKISVAALLLRLIGPNTKWRKWFLYAVSILSFIFSVVTSIITFTQCDPPRALWEKVPGSHCANPHIQTNLSVFLGCWNSAVDMSLALLPITVIWNLKLKLEKKIGLCVLLGLGVLSSISAAIKTSQLPSILTKADVTWATFGLFIWTYTEIFLLIVCGSIATLKPLYDVFLGRRTLTGFRSYQKGSDFYPDKRSYEMHYGTKRPFARNSTGKTMGYFTGNSTTVATSRSDGSAMLKGSESYSELGLGNIAVQHGVDVNTASFGDQNF